jgi:GT2 family glycosyltransferase
MRLGGFVNTFNRPAILRSTIETVLAQSRPPDHLLVVDNGSSPETESIVRAYPPHTVSYHDMGSNAGPAGGAAFGLRTLVDRGYEWIWWGDDDDPPRTPDTFERLILLADGSEDIGVVTAYGSRWNWARGENVWLPDVELHGTLEIDTFGGSTHPLISARAVHAVGVPNAAFFFGYEDHEYSLRIRRAGLRITADGALFREYRTLAGWMNHRPRTRMNKIGRKRSPWRQYYSTRNYIHFMRREFGRGDLARREAFKAVLRALASWVSGPRYGAEFSGMQLAGILDGYADKLGMTVSPVSKY